MSVYPREPAVALLTDRLALPLVTADVVSDVRQGRRRPDWADDFPTPGDQEIAALLDRTRVPTGSAAPFGHRLVVERASALVIGGIGFFAPPDEDGRLEFGFGIAGSRRERGLATEAARCLVSFGLRQPGVTEVLATVEPDNPASIRVVEKAGLTLADRTPSLVTYRSRSVS